MSNEELKKESLPTVFQMDLAKREEFLSQVGSFTQEQRRIFHRICDFYDPALDYNRFILHAGKDILFANNQIEVLMNKLKAAHYGLLQFQVVEGELKPSRIVISNRDSLEYYVSLIDDEIQRSLLDEGRSYLTMEELEEMNQRVPFDLVDGITPDKLSPGFLKENEQRTKIYTITLKSGGSLLCSSKSLKTLVQLSHLRIKSYLKNTSFLTIMSRYMNIKISDIQKKLGSRDRQFWMDLSSKLQLNRDDLQARMKHLENSLFQAGEIVHSFYANAAKEEDNERKENAAKERALEEICLEILKKEDFLVTGEDLLRILDPYEKKWEGFKDHFYEKAVKINNKIGLPLILSINNSYIHRDHVYPYFRSELNMQSRELKYHYVQLMERMLRTGKKSKITVFYTRETFRDDVMEMIKQESPVLAEFLEKPRIISEAIVHYFKNLKKVRDVTKIKDFMNTFFDRGVIRFKDADYLMNLYLLEIFDEAYKFLSLWRKFLLRMSGKKESFRNQFTGIDKEKPSDDMGLSKSPLSQRANASESRGRDLPEMGYSRIRKKDKSTQTPPSYRRRTPQPNPKQYNLKQRNKAWTEFEEAFQRKNR